jgi:hypothetical protein
MTVGLAAEFVEKHKTNGICQDWSFREVIYSIEQAISKKCFCYTEDESGQITGVAWGKMIHDKFYVQTLIATTKKSLNEIILFYRTNFQHVEIVADRGDNFVNYKTKRMLHLLTKVK